MVVKLENGKDKNYFSKRLLIWHKKYGRHNLPWQKRINPYRVWISEIMLQQTQVSVVIPYYLRFMKSYPNLKTLSNTTLKKVMKHWEGLGYYRRAENIYKTSQIIKKNFNNIFPKSYEKLIELPGIGKSTAGAIMSIAYNKKYPILDGNVKRVIIRFEGFSKDSIKEKQLWEISNNLLPNKKNDIFTQAIMDLGATICKKAKPLCSNCPVRNKCITKNTGQELI